MEYRKPEILFVGQAADTIQSNLQKDAVPFDHENIGTMTSGSAYEADE
jgi:hypothetical protein